VASTSLLSKPVTHPLAIVLLYQARQPAVLLRELRSAPISQPGLRGVPSKPSCTPSGFLHLLTLLRPKPR